MPYLLLMFVSVSLLFFYILILPQTVFLTDLMWFWRFFSRSKRDESKDRSKISRTPEVDEGGNSLGVPNRNAAVRLSQVWRESVVYLIPWKEAILWKKTYLMLELLYYFRVISKLSHQKFLNGTVMAKVLQLRHKWVWTNQYTKKSYSTQNVSIWSTNTFMGSGFSLAR